MLRLEKISVWQWKTVFIFRILQYTSQVWKIFLLLYYTMLKRTTPMYESSLVVIYKVTEKV